MSAVPVMTSAAPAVTAQDLELEHAELLRPGKPSCSASSRRATASASSVNDAACRPFRPGGLRGLGQLIPKEDPCLLYLLSRLLRLP